MVNNGSLHYDHDRDGTHTELAGCSSLFRNKDYDTYLAIRYEGSRELLKVLDLQLVFSASMVAVKCRPVLHH